MIKDEQIISEFKKGSMQSLEYLYKQYRTEFVRWAVYKYKIGNEDAEDVFSDAVIDVYQNIMTGKYTKNQNAALKSYLFEVGKNKILNILNKKNITETHHKRIRAWADDSYCIDENGLSEIIARVSELMELIDEKCRRVLSLFYYHNLSMDVIARELGFKNDDVAKNKKLKCLKRLQVLAFNRIDSDDMYD